METLQISLASEDERSWAAVLLSESEPWTTLGISFDQCLENCNDPEYLLLIARIDRQPAGCLILDPRGLAGSPYIKSIAVASEYRNRKTGEALVQHAERMSADNSKHMFLCVSSFNKDAHRFYKRLGYEQVGELKDYIIAGESEVIMHKIL